MKLTLIIIIGWCFCMAGLQAQSVSKLPQKADTLSLREVCYYCHLDDKKFAERPWNDHFLCICYTECKCNSPLFNDLMKKYASGVKVLNIENPSRMADSLDFSIFSSLEELNLFGNDFDTLNSIPGEVFALENMRKITINNISMMSELWNVYVGTYLTIEFVGTPE